MPNIIQSHDREQLPCYTVVYTVFLHTTCYQSSHRFASLHGYLCAVVSTLFSTYLFCQLFCFTVAFAPVSTCVHFELEAPSFLELQFFPRAETTLLTGVNDVLAAFEYSVSSNSDMLELLLYGSKCLSLEANNQILRLPIKHIFETEHFA